jgi:hypothetical protein
MCVFTVFSLRWIWRAISRFDKPSTIRRTISCWLLLSRSRSRVRAGVLGSSRKLATMRSRSSATIWSRSAWLRCSYGSTPGR